MGGGGWTRQHAPTRSLGHGPHAAGSRRGRPCESLTCMKYSSNKQSTHGSATSVGRTSLEMSQHLIRIIFSCKKRVCDGGDAGQMQTTAAAQGGDVPGRSWPLRPAEWTQLCHLEGHAPPTRKLGAPATPWHQTRLWLMPDIIPWLPRQEREGALSEGCS